MDDNYIPGSCNISGAQLHKRKRFAAKCLGLTVWAIVLLEIFDVSKWWRLVMIIFFTLSALAIQQVYFKFCYLFGLKGVFGLDAGRVRQVESEELRRAYRRRSIKMLAGSVLIGIILTAIYFYIGAKFGNSTLKNE